MQVSNNIKRVVKFGVMDEAGGKFRYYALEVEMKDGTVIHFDETDMRELKSILESDTSNDYNKCYK